MIDSTAATSPHTGTNLHPRREPFEHGLLPIPKLIFTDGTATLVTLKHDLLAKANENHRVTVDAVSDVLQISTEHARLALDTLASVVKSDEEAPVIDSDGIVDVYDLILFLYIQSYKRLLPRTRKDSAAVADVWPSTVLLPRLMVTFRLFLLCSLYAAIAAGLFHMRVSLGDIPSCFWGELGSTKDNPFPLPEAYSVSHRKNHDNLTEIKQMLREAPPEDNKKREVSNVLHMYFKDWLYATGNIHQLYYVHGE